MPTYTATQTLSPQGQAIKGQTDSSKYNLAGLANSQSSRISGLLNHEIDVSGGGPGGNAQNILNVPGAATSYDAGGPIQKSLGPAGDITKSYSTDFSQDRQNVQDALMARMNPQLGITKQALQQQLADQGIRYGSDAYNNAMFTNSQQENDARYGAIMNAGQEQQRMVEEEAQRAAFQNQAQQQGYTQGLGQGEFANQAQGQQYQQNAGSAAFNNAGLAQQIAQQQSGFNAQQSQLNEYLQQQFAERNQPINEISSLLSGSQVQQPNFLNTPSSQIPTTDFAGITNQNFQNQMGIYNAQNQNYNSLVGGVLGLGAGALKASDERIKDNVVKLGTVFSSNEGGLEGDNAQPTRKELPIYRYSYKADPASVMHIGPMAQDVEKIDKRAVKNIGGIKHIDTKRVMGNILRAA